MNLQEFYEMARARFPKHDVDACQHFRSNGPTWFWVQIAKPGDYTGPSAIGDTPEEALAGIVIPDRVAVARKMIEDANKILAEEGVAAPFAELTETQAVVDT